MKRPPLSLKAERFAVHAVPQPDPVRVATGSDLTSRTPATGDEAKRHGQASRAGKVQVVAWVAEERRSQLKIVAAKLRRTVDDLLSSMVDDLINKHLHG